MGEGRTGGLWAPQTRALTVGLVLTITFVGAMLTSSAIFVFRSERSGSTCSLSTVSGSLARTELAGGHFV